jgi:hypothetical protein
LFTFQATTVAVTSRQTMKRSAISVRHSGAVSRVYRVGDGLEIDIERTVVEIFGELPGHVITHRCHTVAVTVSYAGQDVELTVHPAVRVKDLRVKAIEALQLDAASSADLVLRLPGETTDLAASHPIGAYVPKGTCSLIVDLVHVVRPQG